MKEHHWNHRIIKQTIDGEDFYSISEVHYNSRGQIVMHTEPIQVVRTSIADIRELCEMILKCLDEPILNEGEIK